MLTWTLGIRDRRLKATVISPWREANRRVVVGLDFPIQERRAPRIVRIVDLQAVGIVVTGCPRIARVQDKATDTHVLGAEECRRAEQKIDADRVRRGRLARARVSSGI